MSGPKVVRVVTREEILAICNGMLARVDAALAEWAKSGLRNGTVDETAVAASVARRDQLAALIAADRFLDLQKQAPLEEAFLRDDIQIRLTEAAEKAAKSRVARLHETQAAKNVLRQLRILSDPLDSNLVSALERGEASAIAQGFRLLAERTTPDTKSAPGFAAGLQTDQPQSSLADWLARQATEPGDPAIERLELRLNELESVPQAGGLAKWRKRLEEAQTAPAARRQLLLDGLEVDTGRALTALRQRTALIFDVRLALAELVTCGVEKPVNGDELERLDQTALEACLKEVKSRLEASRAVSAALARRIAVLQGLAELGYEVTEEMSTSTPQDGRLVLKSATRPDYGVEISASSANEKLQVRVVAFQKSENTPDLARDRDAETIWCGDVAALQDHLRVTGNELIIERAIPVGATPLKRITVSSANESSGKTKKGSESFLRN